MNGVYRNYMESTQLIKTNEFKHLHKFGIFGYYEILRKIFPKLLILFEILISIYC